MVFLASLNKTTYVKAAEDSVSGYFSLYFVSRLHVSLTVINVIVPRAGAMAHPSLHPLQHIAECLAK